MSTIKHRGLEFVITKVEGDGWIISNDYLGLTIQGDKLATLLIDIDRIVVSFQNNTLYDQRMIPYVPITRKV